MCSPDTTMRTSDFQLSCAAIATPFSASMEITSSIEKSIYSIIRRWLTELPAHLLTWSAIVKSATMQGLQHRQICRLLPLWWTKNDVEDLLRVNPSPILYLHANDRTRASRFAHIKVWPECHRWADAVNVTREVYHGGFFTGISCRKLLESHDLFEELCPDSYMIFLQAFRALREVVTSSFSKTLHPDYETKINSFKGAFNHLGINITPKLHAIFFPCERLL